MANAAMVAIIRATGTTATTMNVLDASNAVILATLKAATKFSQ